MVALILAAALTATPSAAPSPAASPALTTIVTVKSSALCGAFAAHVNSAISSAVGNDQTMATMIVSLRSTDLEGTTIRRLDEINRLVSLGDSIYKQYRAGLVEVKQLRDLAAKTTDPDEKAAIRGAADALGGALYRQHLAQRDLDGLVAYLQTGDMRRSDDDPEFPNEHRPLDGTDANAPFTGSYWTPRDGWISTGIGVGTESWHDDVGLASEAADDFQKRMPLILQDEMTAGRRIETAGDHC